MSKSEDKKAVDELQEELKELGLPPITSESEEEDEIDLEAAGPEDDGKEEEESKEEEDSDESEEEEEESEEEDDEEASDEEDDVEESEDDDEEESDEEEEEEDDSDKGSKSKIPRKFIPIKQHKDEKKKHRDEVESLKTVIQDLTKKIEGGGGSQEDQDDVKALATELGIEDPENFQKVLAFIEKSVSKKVQIDPEIAKLVENMKVADQERKDREYFSQTWENFLPEFKKDFQNADAKNLTEARVLMDRIWHTKEWHAYTIDYVYFKNKNAFAKIITPKNRGLETGSSRGMQERGSKKTLALSENASEDEIMRASDAVDTIMAGTNFLRKSKTREI